MGADKSLAQPDWKKQLKFAVFRPTRRSLLPRRPGWTDNLLKFLSALQKLEFGRRSLFPSGREGKIIVSIGIGVNLGWGGVGGWQMILKYFV